MAANIYQVYIANPIISNDSTDLMYFGRSPYAHYTDNVVMTFSNFAAQFGAPYTASALTSTNDTNVTLTLGGIPSSALLEPVSLTLGWNGLLSLSRGGTNANLIASNGGIVWSNASQFQILSGTTTANQVLLSGSSSSPSWSTATYPSSTSINQILYSSANNIISGINSAANGVLITSSGSVPSISSTLPTAVQLNITEVGTITTGVWQGNVIGLSYGGTNANLTASNGGIVWSNASQFQVLSGTTTANQILMSGSSSSPSWSTAVYPVTTSINQLLYSSSSNNITGLSTGNNGVLITSGTGTPSISSTLPTIVQTNITELGTITVGTWNASLIGMNYGGTGANLSPTANNIVYSTSSSMALLATANNGVLITSNLGAPSISSTLPMAVQNNITSVGTIGSGIWEGSVIGLAYGGTGANITATANNLVYSTASSFALLATANNGVLVTSNTGVPSISSTLPSIVQTNITSVGVITSGTWQGSIIGSFYGGTGLGAPSPGYMLVGDATAGNWAFLIGPSGEQILGSDALSAINWTSSLPGAVQANIVIAESQVTNLTSDLNSKLNLAGGTMTGALILSGNAGAPLQAVPLQQLQSASNSSNFVSYTYFGGL